MLKCAVIIENRFPVDDIIERHKKFLGDDWAILHFEHPINSMSEYNRLLTSFDFWDAMMDKVLIFQHDSGLLRTGIDDFLEWDYVGAPIKWLPGYMNGGLSLRSRDVMLDLIENIPYNGETEDMWFCDGLRKLGYKMPSIEEAQKFSVETSFIRGSLGYHAIDKYLTPEECEEVKHQYD